MVHLMMNASRLDEQAANRALDRSSGAMTSQTLIAELTEAGGGSGGGGHDSARSLGRSPSVFGLLRVRDRISWEMSRYRDKDIKFLDRLVQQFNSITVIGALLSAAGLAALGIVPITNNDNTPEGSHWHSTGGAIFGIVWSLIVILSFASTALSTSCAWNVCMIREKSSYEEWIKAHNAVLIVPGICISVAMVLACVGVVLICHRRFETWVFIVVAAVAGMTCLGVTVLHERMSQWDEKSAMMNRALMHRGQSMPSCSGSDAV